MRQIKFRCWDEKNQVMVVQGEPDVETLYSFMFHYGWLDLMQFTGLLDKDGKEIYEGDIVNILLPYRGEGDLPEVNENKQVFFDEGGFTTEKGMYLGFFEESVYTVIGNIFQSPHLLGEIKLD